MGIANRNGALYFATGIDNSRLRNDANESGRIINGISNSASGASNSMARMMKGIGALVSVTALYQFGKQIALVRGEFQQLEIAFQTILKSKGAADDLMAQTIEFAATTPYELREVGTGIKKLLAYNVEAKETIGTLRMLGDISSGLGTDLGGLVAAYGKVKSKGKMQAEEMNLFLERGVPLVRELAKQFNIAEKEVYKMSEAGQIGFKELEGVLRSLTTSGGMFEGMMEKQSKSITGQLSNLADAYSQMLNDMGKSSEGLINSIIAGGQFLLKNYETVGVVLKGLLVVYGAYKLATIAVAREMQIQAATALIVAESNNVLTASEARLWAIQERRLASQAALKASMIANPYVIAAVAAAGLGYAIYKLITYQTEYQKAIKSTNREIENERDKSIDLFGALKNATVGTEKWEKAKKAVLDQYQTYIPEQLKELDNLEKINEAQKLVNKSVAESVAVRSKADAIKAISDKYNPKITGKIEKISDVFDDPEEAWAYKTKMLEIVAQYKEGTMSIDHLRILRDEIYAKMTKENKGSSIAFVNDIFNGLFNNLKDQKQQFEAVKSGFEKWLADYVEKQPEKKVAPAKTTADKQRKELEKQLVAARAELLKMETQEAFNPLEEIEKQKAKIEKLENQLDIKARAKLNPKGSYAELEESIKNVTEAIEKSTKKENPILEHRLAMLKKEKKAWDDIKNAATMDAPETIKPKWDADKATVATAEDFRRARAEIYQQYDFGEISLGDMSIAIDKLEKAERALEKQAKLAGNELRNVDSSIQANIDKANKLKRVYDTDNESDVERLLSKIDNVENNKEIQRLNKRHAEGKISEIKYQSELNRIRVEQDEISGKKVLESYRKRMSILNEQRRKGLIDEQEYQDKLQQIQQEHAQNVIASYQNVFGELSNLVSRNAEKFGLDEKQAEIIQGGLDAFQKIAQGDVIGFIGSMVGTAIDSILGVPELLSEQFVSLQENVSKLIGSLNVANSSLKNIGNGVSKTELRLIESELNKVTKAASSLSKTMANVHFAPNQNINTTYKKAKEEIESLDKSVVSLSEKLLMGGISDDQRKAIEAVLMSYNDLVDAMDQIVSDITGTSVKDLSSALAEIFWDGENAAENWGKKVDEIIKKVIINQMTASLLTKPIQAAIDQLIKDAQTGEYVNQGTGTGREGKGVETNIGLSIEEAKKFSDAIAAAAATYGPAFESARKSLEDAGIISKNGVQDTTLAGEIKRAITEDTASMIVGIANRTGLDIRSVLEVARESLFVQKQIEINTRNTNANVALLVTLQKGTPVTNGRDSGKV